ncbi:MAG: 3-oxoacyl-ACP reductase FabG [Burkholderiaceae bacterium]|nr:3-oxoacyl-ACP reductase FabG [Burkholderiaceae bacterium]
MQEKKIKALVTGGTGAIGQAICLRLAKDAYHVLVHTHQSLQNAQKIVEEITLQGGSAEAIAFDVRDSLACTAALETVLADSPVQVIVNNAGSNDDAVFAGMSLQQWKSVLDVSLNGFFNVTQPLMLPMLRTRFGRIINISSVAALAGNRGQVNYAAAKAALHGASKSLALEVASRGVTVNVVAPGIIASPMTEGIFTEEIIKQLVPMKRAGTSTEVADLVGFLASKQAAYISGQIISINGGMI